MSLKSSKVSLGKKSHEESENHTYIRLYGYKDKPLFFHVFVFNKYFVVEFCKQYNSWIVIFYKEKKNKFISLPFIVGDVTTRNPIDIE